MVKEVRLQISSEGHIPGSEHKKNKFYFELRTGDRAEETYIGIRVWVNNEGSLIANRDILKDAEDMGVIQQNMELNMATLPQIYELIIWER